METSLAPNKVQASLSDHYVLNQSDSKPPCPSVPACKPDAPLPVYANDSASVAKALEILALIKSGDRVYQTRRGEIYAAPKGTGLYHLAFGEGRHTTMERVFGVLDGAKRFKRDLDPAVLIAAARGVRTLEQSFAHGPDVAPTIGRICLAEKELLEIAVEVEAYQKKDSGIEHSNCARAQTTAADVAVAVGVGAGVGVDAAETTPEVGTENAGTQQGVYSAGEIHDDQTIQDTVTEPHAGAVSCHAAMPVEDVPDVSHNAVQQMQTHEICVAVATQNRCVADCRDGFHSPLTCPSAPCDSASTTAVDDVRNVHEQPPAGQIRDRCLYDSSVFCEQLLTATHLATTLPPMSQHCYQPVVIQCDAIPMLVSTPDDTEDSDTDQPNAATTTWKKTRRGGRKKRRRDTTAGTVPDKT